MTAPTQHVPADYSRRIDVCRSGDPDAVVVHCGACQMPGISVSVNERGILVGHPHRAYPCRTPIVHVLHMGAPPPP